MQKAVIHDHSQVSENGTGAEISRLRDTLPSQPRINRHKEPSNNSPKVSGMDLLALAAAGPAEEASASSPAHRLSPRPGQHQHHSIRDRDAYPPSTS